MPEASNENILGRVSQFMIDAVDHRKLMESNLIRLTAKMDNMASDVSEIKIQAYKTNGRVNGHDLIISDIKAELSGQKAAFLEHNLKGVKTDSYLSIVWSIAGIVGGALLVFIVDHLLKPR